MAMFTLKINDVLVSAPTEYSLGQEMVGRFERNANGSMVGDLTAVKVRISCRWGMLSGVEYKRLCEYAKAYFVRVRYTKADGTREEIEMAMRMQEGSISLHREDDSVWWSGVGCEFLER